MLKHSALIFLLCVMFAPARANTDALAYDEQMLNAGRCAPNGARCPESYRLELLSKLGCAAPAHLAAIWQFIYRLLNPGKCIACPPALFQAGSAGAVKRITRTALRRNEILIAQDRWLVSRSLPARAAKLAADAVTLLAALPGRRRA